MMNRRMFLGAVAAAGSVAAATPRATAAAWADPPPEPRIPRYRKMLELLRTARPIAPCHVDGRSKVRNSLARAIHSKLLSSAAPVENVTSHTKQSENKFRKFRD